MLNQTTNPAQQNFVVMCLLALLVGCVSGIGAWLFRLLIGLIHNIMFLGQASLNYDANLHTAVSPWGVGIILVPVIGGMAVVWLVKNFAPEAKGHGVPEVMDAIYSGQGIIRPRVAVIKSLASAISIGSGGAVGREGPIIQIGSAFGSMLGQWVSMPARQRNTLIAAGAGAGIAATFNAPLGGLVFAIELLLVSVSAANLLLVGIATIIATHIGRLLIGSAPSFDIPALQLSTSAVVSGVELLLLVPLGLLMGLSSVLFIRGLYWAEDHFDALPGNAYSRHALGMLCVGVMMYLLMRYSGHYYIQGVGYATIVDILTGALTDPMFLLLLFVLKMVATCLSLGSGASGGVFSPALFMGATLGAAYAQGLTLLFPTADIPLLAFAIAGMAAAIGGSTGAVLTSIIMLTEMTADHNVVLPLMVVVLIATAVRKWLMNESIYTLKLLRRGKVAPEGLQAAMYSSLRVGDVMLPNSSLPAEHAFSDHVNDCIASEQPQAIRCTPDELLITALQRMRAANACVLLVYQSSEHKQLIGRVDEQALGQVIHRHVDLL